MTEGITAMARVAWIPGDPKFKFKPEPDSHAEETLPMSVRNAVMLVNDYFSSRGITTFEIGPLCSRDHATKLHRIRDILKP